MEPWFVLVVNGQVNRDWETDNQTEAESWVDALTREGNHVTIKREWYD